MKKFAIVSTITALILLAIGLISFGVEVEDALGRVLSFDPLPQSIVVPGKASWMVGHPLYMFPEAADRVFAMEARRGTVSDFLDAIVPGFTELPHLDTNSGPEQIAPLHPDAAVLKSYLKDLGDSLELIGIPVVYVNLETPEQFFSDINTIGQLFDNTERAQEIKAFYQQRLDLVAKRVDGLSDQERPRVLILQYMEKGEEGAFSVPPAEYIQTTMAELAGGQPVWLNATGVSWQVVNLEQIAAWDADKIFVIVFRSDPDPVMDSIRSNATWQEMRALQNNELYAFPGDFYGWDSADPRWWLGLTWLAKATHPDLFSDFDIDQEIYDFYGQMYGMEKEQVESIILPVLTGDAQ
jgi:iron complex transport system substrate-binding protein